MPTPADQRPVYRIDLRPEPDVERPILALRAFLKCALRQWGLKCLRAVEVTPGQADAPEATPGAADGGGAEKAAG